MRPVPKYRFLHFFQKNLQKIFVFIFFSLSKKAKYAFAPLEKGLFGLNSLSRHRKGGDSDFAVAASGLVSVKHYLAEACFFRLYTAVPAMPAPETNSRASQRLIMPLSPV